MTIDDWTDQRNEVFFAAQRLGHEIEAECWVRLALANWHIERVHGSLRLLTPEMGRDIQECVMAAKAWVARHAGERVDKP